MNRKTRILLLSLALVLAVTLLAACATKAKTTPTPTPTKPVATATTAPVAPVAPVGAELANVKSELAALRTRVDYLEVRANSSNPSTTQSDITRLKSDLSELRNRVNSLPSGSDSSTPSTDDLRTSVTGLQAGVDALQTSVTNLQAAITAQGSTISGLDTRLGKIEGTTGSGASASGVLVAGTSMAGVSLIVINSADYLLGMNPEVEQQVNFSFRIFNGLTRGITNLAVAGTITSDRTLDLEEGYPQIVDAGIPSIVYLVGFDGSKTIRFESFKTSAGAALSIAKATSLTFRPQVKIKSYDDNSTTYKFTMTVKSVNGD